MIELTEEQLKAMDVEPESRWVDPRTQKTYVGAEANGQASVGKLKGGA